MEWFSVLRVEKLPTFWLGGNSLKVARNCPMMANGRSLTALKDSNKTIPIRNVLAHT
jgi:hypothetical protein